MKLLSVFVLVTVLAVGQGEARFFSERNELPGNGSILSLSGSDWLIHEDTNRTGVATLSEANGWIPATVPGNIQADLESAHKLMPLWYGAGDPRMAEVPQSDWWYRKDFNVPASFAGKRMKLVFDGVDHECEVYLNGEKLGGHGGMYRRVGYDVADVILCNRVNQLAVLIRKMPPSMVEHVGKRIILKHYRRELSEIKSPTNFGLDWGVGIYTIGIWKDVRLEASGDARIEYVHVKTKLSPAYDKATVTVRAEIDSLNAAGGKMRFRLEGNKASVKAQVDVDLKAGTNQVEAVLELPKPALWWPNGQGAQPLYRMYSELLDSRGKTSDSRVTRFGICDVRWEQVEAPKEVSPNPSQLVINGRKVRLMGSNIIPADLLFGRQHEKAERLLRMTHDAGMNVLRNWGGGVNMRDEWYDLADELGILVQQEFPTTDTGEPWDIVDPDYIAAMTRTAVNMLKQLRNHPCIVEWTGGNELRGPDDSPVPNVLRKLVADLDGRIFRSSDPVKGWAHGPYNKTPDEFYKYYSNAVFPRRDEFAAPSPANLEIWHRDIPPASQWPINPEDPVLIRKKVFKAWLGNTWLQPHVLESVFGSLPDLPSLVKGGQWLCADEVRYSMDAMRQSGLKISGFMSWLLNEPWSNGAGNHLVDYDGRPLMNYSFVKQALTPISFSIRHCSLFYTPKDGIKVDMFLVSDAPETADNLKWSWLVRDRRGRIFANGEGMASIKPLEVKQLGRMDALPPAETSYGPWFIEMQLKDAKGRMLGERVQIFSAAGGKSPMAGLVNGGVGTDVDDDHSASAVARPVSRTSLEVSLTPVRLKGDQEIIELVVKNTGKMTALFCEPHPLIEYRTDLFIENNHCFIPPGEMRTLTIRSTCHPKGGLTLEQTGWRVSAWNADDQVIEPCDAVLLALGRRDAMTREYLGYSDAAEIGHANEVVLKGRRPDAGKLPLLQGRWQPSQRPCVAGGKIQASATQGGREPKGTTRFEFNVESKQAKKGALLRIHTADQSKEVCAEVVVSVNGNAYEQTLSKGLGMQNANPAQLAFPSTLVFEMPGKALKSGKNILDVRVKNDGWFTWDALEVIGK